MQESYMSRDTEYSMLLCCNQNAEDTSLCSTFYIQDLFAKYEATARS